MMDSKSVFDGLIARGYIPVQAAALAGHIKAESGGDPTAINPKEDARGIVQWRGPRLEALRTFAAERGVEPTDPNLQLDFIAREMGSTEKRAGAKFAAATDLPSAHAALKDYIRYGTEGDRYPNAQAILRDYGGTQSPPLPAPAQSAPQPAPGAPVASVAPGAMAAPVGTPAPDAEAEQQQMAALQGISKMLAPPVDAGPQLAAIAPPQMTAPMIRARQLAAAMLKRSMQPAAPAAPQGQPTQ